MEPAWRVGAGFRAGRFAATEKAGRERGRGSHACCARDSAPAPSADTRASRKGNRGAPGGTRTHDLQVRNLTLYPLSYGRAMGGGEGGIRTLDAGYPTWRFSKPLH